MAHPDPPGDEEGKAGQEKKQLPEDRDASGVHAIYKENHTSSHLGDWSRSVLS